MQEEYWTCLQAENKAVPTRVGLYVSSKHAVISPGDAARPASPHLASPYLAFSLVVKL